MPESRFCGQTVFISGASGGIGIEVAREFAVAGCNLVVQGHRNLEPLVELASNSKRKGSVLVVEGDVRDPDSVGEMMRRGVESFGTIEICVPCAGIWPTESLRLDQLSVERIREVIDTNLLGTLYVARAFLDQIVTGELRGTSLVLVGSTAGSFGEAGHTDYSVSKAALRGLMLSYKNEVVVADPRGRCNLVEPGWTATPMADEALNDDRLLSRSIQTMPLRRLAHPRDITSVVLFLASPAAAHVTGQTITVAGGMEGRVLWEPSQIEPDTIRNELKKV